MTVTDPCVRCRRRAAVTAGGLCRMCFTDDQAAARGWLRVSSSDRTAERWWRVCKERGIPYGLLDASQRWHWVTFDTWSAPRDSDAWKDTADLRMWAVTCAVRHAFAHGRREPIFFSASGCSAVHPDISEHLVDALAAAWHGDTAPLRAFIDEHARYLVPDDPRHLTADTDGAAG